MQTMSSYKKGLLTIGLLGLVAGLLLGYRYYIADNTATTQPSEIDTIRIGYVTLQSFGLVMLADKLGYFTKQGLHVEMVQYNTGRDSLLALNRGEVDMGMAYDFPFIQQSVHGSHMKVVASLHRSSKGTGLVVNKNRINKVAEMRGKKIAYVPGTASEYVLDTLLVGEGLKRADVTLFAKEPPEIKGLFKKGEIDGAVLFEPHIFDVQKIIGEQNSSVFFSDQYIENSLLVIPADSAQTNTRAITKVIASLINLDNDMKKSSSVYNDYLRYFKDLLPNASEEKIRKHAEIYTYMLDLDNTLVQLLTTELNDLGVDINQVKNLIDSNCMQILAPQKVKIISLYEKTQ